MKHWLIILLAIAVVLIGAGVGAGIYTQVRQSEIDKALATLDNFEHQIINSIIDQVNNYIYPIQIVDKYNKLVNITTQNLKTFNDFMALESTNTFKLSNEIKYVPIIQHEDRENFKNFANTNIKPGFNIQDFLNGSFTPSPDRDFYCPLSYFAPNNSALYDFIGTDICYTPTWQPLISKLANFTDQTIQINSRYVVRTDTYILDIAKNIIVNNVRRGICIHSFFFSEFVSQIINNIYQVSNNTNQIFISVSDNDVIIYEHENFTVTPDRYLSEKNADLSADNRFSFRFKYSTGLVDSFTTDNDVITLVIVILLFVIISAVILISYIVYGRKKQQQSMNKLERRNSYISTMINYVNHEVRNPLNCTIGMIDMVKMEIDDRHVASDAPILSNLSTAYNSCILIKHVVDDVLDIKKLEEGKLELFISNIDMNKFATELTKLISPKTQEKPNITFTINNEIDTMISDPYRLTQIIINMVFNSFKFTDEGYITVNIQSVDFDAKEMVTISIADSGNGVNDKDLLFMPFVKSINNNVISRQVGSGLGLYLCKMIVELMGGTIGFHDNDEGLLKRGSVFWFTVPRYMKETKSSV